MLGKLQLLRRPCAGWLAIIVERAAKPTPMRPGTLPRLDLTAALSAGLRALLRAGAAAVANGVVGSRRTSCRRRAASHLAVSAIFLLTLLRSSSISSAACGSLRALRSETPTSLQASRSNCPILCSDATVKVEF